MEAGKWRTAAAGVFLVGSGFLPAVRPESYPANSMVCDDWNRAPKELRDCRLGLAGGFECRDESACTDYFCSDEDAARRAGMTCAGFPGYNGGYPISPVHWDSEVETYTCLEERGNATVGFYCHEWETLEDSPSEYEVGTCSCLSAQLTSAGAVYCNSWTCEQVERDKCAAGEIARPTAERPTSCCYQCDEYGSAASCRCAYDLVPEREFGEASCVTVEEGGWCSEWHQEEFDEHDYRFREFEDYKCINPLEPGPGDKYCAEWRGNINSKEEFEFSDCECTTEAASGDYCEAWRCYEKGMEYFYPNLLWSLLVVILGLAPVMALVLAVTGIKEPCGTVTCWAILSLIWTGGWLVLSVWLGGIGVLLIFFSIVVGLSAILFCASRTMNWRDKRHQRKKDQREEGATNTNDPTSHEIELALDTDEEQKEDSDPNSPTTLCIEALSGRTDTLQINPDALGIELKQRVLQLDMVATVGIDLKQLRLVIADGSLQREVDPELELLAQDITSTTKLQVTNEI